jgi:hypothetical protein
LPKTNAVQRAEHWIHDAFGQRPFVWVSTVERGDEIEAMCEHRTGQPLQPQRRDRVNAGIDDDACSRAEALRGGQDAAQCTSFSRNPVVRQLEQIGRRWRGRHFENLSHAAECIADTSHCVIGGPTIGEYEAARCAGKVPNHAVV